MPTRVIAGSFALIAFSFALLLGLTVGNDALTIIGRAMVCAGFSYLVGLMIAHVGRRAVLEHVERYAERNPIPSRSREPDSTNHPAAAEQPTDIAQDASGDGPAVMTAPAAA